MLGRVAMCWLLAGVLPAALVSSTINEETPRMISPAPYQVVQREGFDPTVAPANDAEGDARGSADVDLAWMAPSGDGEWQARIVPREGAFGKAVNWTKLDVTKKAEALHASWPVPAGGWYRLDLRHMDGDQVKSELTVEPFGVGEVFLIAGQSYAGGHNDERLKVTEPGRHI